MERRKFLTKSAGAATLLAIGAQQTNAMMKHADNSAAIITHYVLFWLNEDLSEREIEEFTGFFKELSTIPTIKTLQYGKPASTNARDVVDNSFTYNLLVQFTNLDDITVYEKHPIHLAAIKKYSKYWNKVEVHDSLLTKYV